MSAYLVAPNEGKTMWLGVPEQGLGVDFKIWGQQTGGAFSIVEHPISPGTLVVPHTHANEDEFSYVLEGTIGARIGDEIVEATPGCYVLKPRSIPHSFWNPGPEHARLIEIISPAGFEKYFAEVGELLRSSDTPDMEAIGRLAARYGLTFHIDWVPDLVAKYNLRPPR